MQRPQAQKLCDKMYPGCRVISFHESDATDGPVVLTTESKDCGDRYSIIVEKIKNVNQYQWDITREKMDIL